jgi:hypothetical protein
MILTTINKVYSLRDYLRGALIAPLASIPGTILGYFFFFAVNEYIDVKFHGQVYTGLISELDFILRAAFIFVLFALPSAYISTVVFGAIGVSIANSKGFRITITIGIAAGVVCGGLTGILWIILFSWPGSASIPRVAALLGPVIFPIALFSGVFVGAVYPKLINRPRLSAG